MDSFLFRFLMRDFLTFRRLGLWFFVCVVVALMAFGYLAVSTNKSPNEAYPMLSSILVFRLLPLAAAVFSTLVIAAEVEQKTIVYLLTRPMPRARMLISRLLAVILMVMIVGVMSALMVSGVTYKGEFLSNPYLWRDIPAILMGSIAYCSLFVFLSLLINRSMIVSLLYAFAWETSIPNMPGSMYVLSLNSYLTALAERPSVPSGNMMSFLAGNLGTNTLTKEQSFIILTIVISVLVGVSMVWFTKFEYTPREDAE
jgi:ABC-2 type transport system permease protein